MVSVLLALGCAGAGAEKADTSAAELDTAASVDTAETGQPPDTGDTGDTAEPVDTASLVDADADGYTIGEGDCDDTLPHVYPGAPDYCDGLDQDCDGEPIPDGSCGAAADATAMWTWSMVSHRDSQGGVLYDLGDVDGDGLHDLVGDLDHGSNTSGVFFGATLVTLAPVSDNPILQWQAGGSGSSFAWPAADQDGDGFDDVLVQSEGNDGMSTGALYLFYGSPEGFPYVEQPQYEVADVQWTAPTAAYFRPGPSVGEFTGDDRPDNVVSLATAWDHEWSWVVVEGGPRASGEFQLSDLPPVTIDEEVWSHPVAVGDLDGDGFDEVTAWCGWETQPMWLELALVEGEDLRSGSAFSDVAHKIWVAADVATYIEPGPALDGRAPDLDGDGLAELVVGVAYDDDTADLMMVAGGVPDGAVNDRVHSRITRGSNWAPIDYFWVDDLDGDAVPDLMLNTTCVVRASTLAEPGVHEHDEASGPCLGNGYALAVADMTGDGLPEWVFGDPYYGYGRTLILAGFEIPWDDPSKW